MPCSYYHHHANAYLYYCRSGRIALYKVPFASTADQLGLYAYSSNAALQRLEREQQTLYAPRYIGPYPRPDSAPSSELKIAHVSSVRYIFFFPMLLEWWRHSGCPAVIQPRPRCTPLQTLLPKARTLPLFCRLSSGERTSVAESASPALRTVTCQKTSQHLITGTQKSCQLVSQHVVSLKTRFPCRPNVSEKLLHPREELPQAGPNVMSISNSQPIIFRPNLRTKVDTAVLCCLAHPPPQLSPRSGASRHWVFAIRVGPHIASPMRVVCSAEGDW